MGKRVEEFLRDRPCPCSCDGYAEGLRLQLELPEAFPVPAYPEVTAEVLEPLLRWRASVMAGKSTPAPDEQRRCGCYAFVQGRKPKVKSTPPPAQQGRSPDRVALDFPSRSSRFGPKPKSAGGSRFAGKEE